MKTKSKIETPFNLKEALLGEEVVTRGGLEVRNVKHSQNSRLIYALHAEILTKSGWEQQSFTEDGEFYKNCSHENDLFMLRIITGKLRKK